MPQAGDAQAGRRPQFDHERVAGSVERGLQGVLGFECAQAVDIAGSRIADKIRIQIGIDCDAGAAIHAIATEISGEGANLILVHRRGRINLRKESILRSVERGLECAEGGGEVGRSSRSGEDYVVERRALRIQHGDR